MVIGATWVRRAFALRSGFFAKGCIWLQPAFHLAKSSEILVVRWTRRNMDIPIAFRLFIYIGRMP
jgi:hypothetical protein